jgi:hypothetical protein
MEVNDNFSSNRAQFRIKPPERRQIYFSSLAMPLLVLSLNSQGRAPYCSHRQTARFLKSPIFVQLSNNFEIYPTGGANT